MSLNWVCFLTGSLPSQSNNFSFKRPYGVAVLNIEEMVTSSGEEKEFMFKVYQGEDKDFHQIHDLIIRKQSNKFSPVSSQHSYGTYFLISKVCFIMHNKT